MNEIKLNDNWILKCTETGASYTTDVPGSVFATLLDNGVMQDPFYRENEDLVEEYALRSYVMTKTFDVGKEFLNEKAIRLECDGIDTFSEIYINNTFVANTENMFLKYVFDIKKYLIEGENTIVVKIDSALRRLAEYREEKGSIGAGDFAIFRKAHYMFGWDWGPSITDMGIWRPISIKGYSEPRISDVYVKQEHSINNVSLDVEIDIEHFLEPNYELETEVFFNEELIASSKEFEPTFTISNPELWWPVGYGKQPLYYVRVSVYIDGKVIDCTEKRVGLRTITIRQEEDKWGESFEFIVNGIPVFIKGGNYIPEDNIINRITREKTAKLIQDCVDVNFNCIRVWGGGYYLEDHFYDMCDEQGILVWQDFMYACAIYPPTIEFEENIKKETIYQLKRLRNHTSIALWCGNNECEALWLEEWGGFKGQYTPENRRGYLRVFEIILPDLVDKYSSNTFYWPSSPTSDGMFGDTNGDKKGDVHCWYVWHSREPIEFYRSTYYRFVSEFGFQSFPNIKTIKGFTLPEDRNIFSPVMEKHQKNPSANGKILQYLSDTYRYPKDFDNLVYLSQILQYDAVKCGVEHWRRNRDRCMGAIYWQINDCWPVASWASIDGEGRWKPLHYGAKKFFAPITTSCYAEKGNVYGAVVNDTLEEFNGKIKYFIKDSSNNVVEEGKFKVTCDKLSAKGWTDLDFTKLLSERYRERQIYFEFLLFDDKGDIISRGTEFFSKPKHFEFCKSEISFDVIAKDDEYIISLNSDAFVASVWIDFEEYDSILSDNCFDITDDETVETSFKKGNISLNEVKRQIRINTINDSF